MKLDSKYFDKVRVKPGAERMARAAFPACEWPSCQKPGRHRAPKGRGHEGEFRSFCLEHVQQYNKTYNYFDGMKDAEIASWQKDALTGHRPTWRLGDSAPPHNEGKRAKAGFRQRNGFRDPLGLLGKNRTREQTTPNGRPVRNAELKALHKMGLDESATADTVKKQYKVLVKRMHPDANGGSRANEEKLREVIQAYDYLRSTGFC
jgi:hypothetical protein